MLDPEQYTDDLMHYTCRRCQSRLRSLEADWEHYECGPREVDTARQREAIRRLERHTAEWLRGLGWHGRAEIHERAAERVR